jgi:integrase
MASVRKKQGSKFWFACFNLPDGTRAQRSTKETDRKKALRLADRFEDAARGRTTARQAQRVISEIFQDTTGSSLPSSSIRDYFESWLARKKSETAPSTHIFYTAKARRFLGWLNGRSENQLFTINPADVVAFRASEAERVSPATVNHGIKLLRMIFEDARRDGILADNPADCVKPVKRSDRPTRRPLTLPEIKRVLAIANSEWRSLILFGLYTGQRLGDLARLTWANVDPQRAELRLATSKTGRWQIIPIAPPLRRHIESLPTGDDLCHPLHPLAYRAVFKSQKVGTLSRQFTELMACAGLVAAKKHRKSSDSDGCNGRRTMSEISFHSLRHTATSLLKNAGVSSAIVQDIIGHESAAISANYTHIDETTKRIALASLPDITRPMQKRRIAAK